MNERIAKLANGCGFDVDKTGTFGNYSEMHRLEKFAELIVKECAKVIQNEKDWMLNNTPDLDNMNAMLSGMSTSKALIKQHFGVEE